MRTLDILNEAHYLSIKPGYRLEAEVEEGNHEYKVKLTNLTDAQINHRISQLLWRLNEGNNEAIYHIGVEDDGTQLGLNEADLKESLRNLQYMADQTSCEMIVRQLYAGEMGLTAEVVMKRRERSTIDASHLTVAVAGDADCGKSTLIGVLSYGQMDNGKGLARMQVLRHNHEVETGRTSCVSHTVLHFNQDGEILNSHPTHDRLRTLSDLELASESTRSVSLVDLAGSPRYFKTTLSGITSLTPDYCLVCVSAVKGLQSMTVEHVGIGLYLQVPLVVVITKVDQVAPPSTPSLALPQHPSISKVLASLQLLFSGKAMVHVQGPEDVAALLTPTLSATPTFSTSVVPVFFSSSVSGLGLDLLSSFLYQLPSKAKPVASGVEEQPEEDMVRLLGCFGRGAGDGEETTGGSAGDIGSFFDPPTPAVFLGKVVKGRLQVGGSYSLGPTPRGDYLPLTLTSLRLNNVPVRYVSEGQTATFRLARRDEDAATCAGTEELAGAAGELGRKRSSVSGLVLLSSPSRSPQVAIWEFTVSLLVLNHPSKVRCNYQPVVHIGSVKQVAKLVSIEKSGLAVGEEGLGNGERAECRFRFMFYPEYFCVGDAVIIREDRTRAVGTVLQIHIP